MNEVIRISGLRLDCLIGVPEEEREARQELRAEVTIWPRYGFPDRDEITGTIDYAVVCARLRLLAEEGERLLLETLVTELCEMLLRDFPCRRVRIELRKFILPETDWVGVSLEKEAEV